MSMTPTLSTARAREAVLVTSSSTGQNSTVNAQSLCDRIKGFEAGAPRRIPLPHALPNTSAK